MRKTKVREEVGKGEKSLDKSLDSCSHRMEKE